MRSIQLFVLLAVAVARMEAADAESSRLDHDDSYEQSASQQSRQLIGTYGFGPGGSAYGLDGLSGGPFSAFGGLSGSAPFQPSQLLSIGFDSPAYATGYAGYRPTYGSSYGNQNAYNAYPPASYSNYGSSYYGAYGGGYGGYGGAAYGSANGGYNSGYGSLYQRSAYNRQGGNGNGPRY